MSAKKEVLKTILIQINNDCLNTTKVIERYFGEPEHPKLIESLQQLNKELDTYFISLE